MKTVDKQAEITHFDMAAIAGAAKFPSYLQHWRVNMKVYGLFVFAVFV